MNILEILKESKQKLKMLVIVLIGAVTAYVLPTHISSAMMNYGNNTYGEDMLAGGDADPKENIRFDDMLETDFYLPEAAPYADLGGVDDRLNVSGIDKDDQESSQGEEVAASSDINLAKEYLHVYEPEVEISKTGDYDIDNLSDIRAQIPERFIIAVCPQRPKTWFVDIKDMFNEVCKGIADENKAVLY